VVKFGVDVVDAVIVIPLKINVSLECQIILDKDRSAGREKS